MHTQYKFVHFYDSCGPNMLLVTTATIDNGWYDNDGGFLKMS